MSDEKDSIRNVTPQDSGREQIILSEGRKSIGPGPITPTNQIAPADNYFAPTSAPTPPTNKE